MKKIMHLATLTLVVALIATSCQQKTVTTYPEDIKGYWEAASRELNKTYGLDITDANSASLITYITEEDPEEQAMSLTYDATTGNFIPLQERVGLLDRKLRIVSENVDDKAEWIEWARKAYQNIYAYEWQGDNLLLAREAILITFVEYYQDKFGQAPDLEHIKDIAYIISWNVWQMDGLKCVVPNSCHSGVKVELTLFGEEVEKDICEGCRKGDVDKHNGTYCKIIDWSVKDSTGNYGKKIEFRKLLK